MNRTRFRVLFATAAAVVLAVSPRVAADPPVKEADTKGKEGKVEVPPLARQVFPLKFANAKDLATVITQLFAMPSATDQNRRRGGFGGGGDRGGGGQQPGGTSEVRQAASKVVALADDQSNSLIVSAIEETLQKVSKIVAKLDVIVFGTTETRIFRLENADSTEVAETINALYADDSTHAKAASVGDTRTNSLLVAATSETHAEIAEMIGRLDATDAKRQRVYTRSLQHEDPDAVASVLRKMLGDDAPVQTVKSHPAPWLGDIITPLEKSRLVIPPSDRVRK